MTDDPQDLTRDLDDLLERERLALLAGDLDSVVRLMGEKEALLHRLHASAGGFGPELQRLKDMLERNQVLVQSAIEGVRSATGKIARGRRARGRVDTYDKAGQRTTIDVTRNGQVERRA